VKANIAKFVIESLLTTKNQNFRVDFLSDAVEQELLRIV
jgi:hypothetical protein